MVECDYWGSTKLIQIICMFKVSSDKYFGVQFIDISLNSSNSNIKIFSGKIERKSFLQNFIIEYYSLDLI